MLSSHFLSMILVATGVLFLMSMPAYEASIIIPGEEQNLLGQVPPISLPLPNPPTTNGPHSPSTISQKAFASNYDINCVSPSQGRKLLMGYVPPSAPNLGSHITASTRSHDKAAPLLGSLQKSPPHVFVSPSAPNLGSYIPSSTRTQRNSPPPRPSMLNKVYITPSTPNSGTYIPSFPPHPPMLHKAYYVSPPNPGSHVPASASTTSPNTAPLHKSPPHPSMPNEGTSIP